MRFFLIGLLLLNIVIFAWQQFNDDLLEESFVAVDKGAEGLVLVREQDDIHVKSQQPVISPSASTATTSPVSVQNETKDSKPAVIKTVVKTKSIGPFCYQLGQFAAKKEADVALTGMSALDYKVKLRVEYPPRAKFLVYLPAYPSINEARKVTRDLKSKGISDFQILAVYGKKNGISLGVFSQYEIAVNRVKEIQNLGYEPILYPVSGNLSYKIDFSKHDKTELSGQESGFLLKSFKNVKIRPIKCT